MRPSGLLTAMTSIGTASTRKPWTSGELADRVGFDNLWFVEHHFLMGFSGSPCPEVLFGALSQRTKNIRIGFGVSILPNHHPVRIAERVAMVDQLTDGRVEFGTGRSNAYEQIGQGIEPPGDPRPLGRSHFHAAADLAGRGRIFRGKGSSGTFRPAGCCPGCTRSPIPAFTWLAPRRTASAWRRKRASAVLSSASYAVDILAEHMKVYREAVKNANPVGAFVNEFWGNNVHSFCGRDDQEAKELCAQSMKNFFGPDKPYIAGRIGAYEELLEAWGGVPDHLKADFGRWLRQSDGAHQEQAAEAGISLDSGPGAARAAIAQLDANTLSDRGVIIAGDPESCIKTVKMYEDIGVDQVMLIMQTETIEHDRVMESIELFGKEVIPAFQREEAAVADN